jgi:hypothetical protein
MRLRGATLQMSLDALEGCNLADELGCACKFIFCHFDLIVIYGEKQGLRGFLERESACVSGLENMCTCVHVLSVCILLHAGRYIKCM